MFLAEILAMIGDPIYRDYSASPLTSPFPQGGANHRAARRPWATCNRPPALEATGGNHLLGGNHGGNHGTPRFGQQDGKAYGNHMQIMGKTSGHGIVSGSSWMFCFLTYDTRSSVCDTCLTCMGSIVHINADQIQTGGELTPLE